MWICQRNAHFKFTHTHTHTNARTHKRSTHTHTHSRTHAGQVHSVHTHTHRVEEAVLNSLSPIVRTVSVDVKPDESSSTRMRTGDICIVVRATICLILDRGLFKYQVRGGRTVESSSYVWESLFSLIIKGIYSYSLIPLVFKFIVPAAP